MTARAAPPRMSADEWRLTIGIPASAGSKGRTSIYSGPDADASYELAQLPDGGWGVNVRCAYECGDKFGSIIPWRLFSTEAECVDFALEEAREHFAHTVFSNSERQINAQGKLLAMLDCLIAERQTPGAEVRPDRATPIQKSLFSL